MVDRDYRRPIPYKGSRYLYKIKVNELNIPTVDEKDKMHANLIKMNFLVLGKRLYIFMAIGGYSNGKISRL